MSTPTRGRFEGVANIVRFNWPFYAGALIAIAALAGLALLAPRWFALVALLGAAGAVWLLGASLLASHWIYDRSALYRWSWLRELLPAEPGRIANVHAGFDESSEALRALFPRAELVILDFYDPDKSPEPSIARARRAHPPAEKAIHIRPEAWPLPDASCDALCLLLAAHELRRRADRLAFFAEARRILAPEGRVVLAEHLRDLANFLAFGPGFFHFLPRREWLQAAEGSGLVVEREFPITPFIRIFLLATKC